MRLALLPLVGGSLLLLFTGVGNVNQWRPWDFHFTTGHYAAAWITAGALLIHIAAKWATARTAIGAGAERLPEAPLGDGGLGRRGFIATVLGASTGRRCSRSARRSSRCAGWRCWRPEGLT